MRSSVLRSAFFREELFFPAQDDTCLTERLQIAAFFAIPPDVGEGLHARSTSFLRRAALQGLSNRIEQPRFQRQSDTLHFMPKSFSTACPDLSKSGGLCRLGRQKEDADKW